MNKQIAVIYNTKDKYYITLNNSEYKNEKQIKNAIEKFCLKLSNQNTNNTLVHTTDYLFTNDDIYLSIRNIEMILVWDQKLEPTDESDIIIEEKPKKNKKSSQSKRNK